MVSTDYKQLTREFEQMVDKRDLAGIAVTGLNVAVGGVVASEASNRILSAVGQPTGGARDSPTEFLASAAAKGGVGAGMAMLAMRLDGMPRAAVAGAGLGAAVLAGTDLWRLLNNFAGGSFNNPLSQSASASSTPSVSRASTSNTRSRTRSAARAQVSPTSNYSATRVPSNDGYSGTGRAGNGVY